jgi:Subtilase family
LIYVKVLDKNGDGSASGVLAGLEWVASNGKPGDVANLSLGGQPSLSLDTAVKAVARQGIRITLAAGNSASLAEDMSPGRVNADNVYTISAIDMNDRRASFSNYGSPPIDYAAPGVDIRSTWNRGRYATLSGTSMASPHVAGLLLLDHYQVDGRMKEVTNADPILVNQRGGGLISSSSSTSTSTVPETTTAVEAGVVVELVEEKEEEDV